MAKKMTRAALFFMIGTVILTVFYKKTAYGSALSLAITFGTVSYHLSCGCWWEAHFRQ